MSPAENWLLLVDGPGPAAWNMGLDEALLEASPMLARPVLRFYGWAEPVATFGYFQAYATVECLTVLRPLIRRPTGGGLVPHDRDWTYTLVFPPQHPWYSLKARSSYEKVHDWLRRAFARIGLSTRLATASIAGSGQCFVGAEQFDVLLQGAKIAGAAQRRSRTGLLIQGSVQPPPQPPLRKTWQDAVTEEASNSWQVRWEDFTLPSDLRARAGFLTTTKYSQSTHNQRR